GAVPPAHRLDAGRRAGGPDPAGLQRCGHGRRRAEPGRPGGRHLSDGVTTGRAAARRKLVVRHILVYAGLTPFVLIALFPIGWMAITAFKQDADLYRMDQVPFWFHLPPTLKHFRILFQ